MTFRISPPSSPHSSRPARTQSQFPASPGLVIDDTGNPPCQLNPHQVALYQGPTAGFPSVPNKKGEAGPGPWPTTPDRQARRRCERGELILNTTVVDTDGNVNVEELRLNNPVVGVWDR